MTPLPNALQFVAMSTVVSPVTQTTETAVKRASAKLVPDGAADAAGTESSAVKTTIRAMNTPTANRAGDAEARSVNESRARPRIPARTNGVVAISPLATGCHGTPVSCPVACRNG
jgi:hypothetical protein